MNKEELRWFRNIAKAQKATIRKMKRDLLHMEKDYANTLFELKKGCRSSRGKKGKKGAS